MMWNRRLKDILILSAVAGCIGVVVLVSGIVPIKASGGHWRATRWLLDFASDRSIALHSRNIKVPVLFTNEAMQDRPILASQMVTLGAATYHSNCRWCHGRPGMPQSATAAAMTPRPPRFPDELGSWDPEELFYILKHGIKFAGMPAWPTQKRDDDIWPLVEFLKQLKTMDASTYIQYVSPDEVRTAAVPLTASTLDSIVSQCSGCHGNDGQGRAGPMVPVLAGQSESYLRNSLAAYRSGQRYSGIMQPIATVLTDAQIAQAAAHYADLEVPTTAGGDVISPQVPESLAAAESLVTHGDRDAKIPSCIDCHGPGRVDPAKTRKSSDYPRLSGQPAMFLQRQLMLFKNRSRGGTEHANLMHPISDKLNESQIRHLAEFYANAIETGD